MSQQLAKDLALLYSHNSQLSSQRKATEASWESNSQATRDRLDTLYNRQKNDMNQMYEKMETDSSYHAQQSQANKERQWRNEQAAIDRRRTEDYSRKINQQSSASRNGISRSITNSGSAFGKYSGPTLMRGSAPYMGNLASGNQQRIKDYQFQRGQAAQTASMISRAEAAGDIARTQANTRSQKAILAEQGRQQQLQARNQNSWQAQQNAAQRRHDASLADKQYENQMKLARMNNRTQKQIAGMDAQAKLWSSAWGSFSNGNKGGYSYWGGTI